MRTCIPRPSRLPTHLRCKYFHLYQFKILSPAYLCNSLLWWSNSTNRFSIVHNFRPVDSAWNHPSSHNPRLLCLIQKRWETIPPSFLSYIDSAPSIRESVSIFPETWDQKLGYWVIYLWRAPVETHIPGNLAIIWHTKQRRNELLTLINVFTRSSTFSHVDASILTYSACRYWAHPHPHPHLHNASNLPLTCSSSSASTWLYFLVGNLIEAQFLRYFLSRNLAVALCASPSFTCITQSQTGRPFTLILSPSILLPIHILPVLNLRRIKWHEDIQRIIHVECSLPLQVIPPLLCCVRPWTSSSLAEQSSVDPLKMAVVLQLLL